MIILITGASHTGKTLLAQKLLEKYNYPYLSIDHLKMGMIRSGNTQLTPVSADTELTMFLWPIVREIIKTVIENRQNFLTIPNGQRRPRNPLPTIRVIYAAVGSRGMLLYIDKGGVWLTLLGVGSLPNYPHL